MNAPGAGTASGVTAYGSPATGNGAAQATGTAGAAAGPAMASAQPYPETRPGTQTVMVPPPPLMAVPATPLTAPIQYETGQNGGTIGNAQIGGGFGSTAPLAYGGSGSAGFSNSGTGVFNQTTPPPSGVFIPGTPAPTTASPGIPASPPLITTSGTAPVPSGAPPALPQTPQPINAQPAPIPGATAPVSPPTR